MFPTDARRRYTQQPEQQVSKVMDMNLKTTDSTINAVLAAIPEPFFVFDENGHYVDILGGVDRNKYHDGRHLVGKRIHDVMAAPLADDFLAQIRKAIESEAVHNYTYQLSAKDIKGSEALTGPEGKQWFEAHISPIRNTGNQPRMVVWISFNITPARNALSEKDALIAELQQAFREIKTLRGILPICSYCKKIRDDKGYWNRIEEYIRDHSESDFSHGICPECARKHYPAYFPSDT